VTLTRSPGSYVLVIDRGNDLGEPAVPLLRRRGYDVEECIDRSAAMAAMRQCTPAIVILDLGTECAAERSGLLRDMQQDPTLASVPICVIADEPTSPGPAVLVIQRPIPSTELRQIVADYCAPIGRDDR
jgi:DNA-binding response OmpR family regulator